jgi:hypothetical protein
VQSGHTERLHQHSFHKLPRRQIRQRSVERQQHHRIDARLGQQPQPLGNRRKKRGRLLRPQKLLRMGLKGDGQTAALIPKSFGSYRVQNFLVPPVYPIKVADSCHARAKTGWYFGNRAVHGNLAAGVIAHRLTGNARPS